MKCPDIGTIQAYIDGELEISIRKEFERHIEECAECRMKLADQKLTDDYNFEKISQYRQYFNEEPVSYGIQTATKVQNNSHTTKGANFIMKNYKKVIAAACSVALITTCITVQPVRAAISEMLSVFRVENVKGIHLSIRDMDDIQKKISKKSGEINLNNMGKINMEGGKEKVLSLSEAKKLQDVKYVAPSALKDIEPQIKMIEPMKIDFTFDVEKMNSMLKVFESKSMLPEEVDGKKVTAEFSRSITTKYSKDGKVYDVTVSESPEIKVPNDVNIDQIYNTMVELPMLPENLKNQLKSIKDWKKTMIIPVVDSQTEEIKVNGATGVVASTDTKHGVRSWIIWSDNGAIYTMTSNTDKEDIIKIARSMR